MGNLSFRLPRVMWLIGIPFITPLYPFLLRIFPLALRAVTSPCLRRLPGRFMLRKGLDSSQAGLHETNK